MMNESIGTLIKNRLNRYKLVLDVAEKSRAISKEAEDRGELLIEKPVSLAINQIAAEYENKE